MSEDTRDRLVEVRLVEDSFPPASSNIEQERRIALFDLAEKNSFIVAGADAGPYVLELRAEEQRLVFDIADQQGARVVAHTLSLSALRKVIKDYFLVCDSYYAAIRDAPPAQIEAIDMGRRGLHNEGAEILAAELEKQFKLDLETARRLFTLVCALHVRG